MDTLWVYVFLKTILMLLAFMPLFVFFYFFNSALLSSVPPQIYGEYMYQKSFLYFDDGNYMLSKCTSRNQTLFLIETERDLYEETVQKVYDAAGNEICTNDFSIYECKASCPYDKCINASFTCEVIASKYPAKS